MFMDGWSGVLLIFFGVIVCVILYYAKFLQLI